MKRTFYLSFLTLLCALPLFAQKGYTPNSNWPYIYEQFSSGKIISNSDQTAEYEALNICLSDGKLHFVQNGQIMEATGDIAQIEIGSDIYIFASGAMVKVLEKTEHSAVVEKTTIDYDAMNKADIGYGKSAIASTQNLSLEAITGGMDYSSGKSLGDVISKKNAGQALATRQSKGILYNGMFVPATRLDILNIYGINKEAAKAFIKKEKINFRKNADLAKLAEFITNKE